MALQTVIGIRQTREEPAKLDHLLIPVQFGWQIQPNCLSSLVQPKKVATIPLKCSNARDIIAKAPCKTWRV